MRHSDKRPARCSRNQGSLPILIVLAFFILLHPSSLRAQESQQSTPALQNGLKLSPERLKAFEGYFQSPDNKEMYLQFAAREEGFMVTLLWANRSFRLVPQSDSSFLSADLIEGRNIPVLFIKDRQGVFSRVRVINNETWTRVNNYKQMVRVEIPHTPGQLKTYEGLYSLHGANGRYIQFSEKDNHLVLLQIWDGREISFVPDTTDHFFCKDQALFTLKFNKDDKGGIRQVVAFGRDYWDKVDKAVYTLAQLKAFEGKYQLKDDKDDLIRITATDSSLVIRQLWDKKEIVVLPLAGTFFYNKGLVYSLYFRKDNNGAISEAYVLDTDLFEKIKE
jgi:hypothetical protein